MTMWLGLDSLQVPMGKWLGVRLSCECFCIEKFPLVPFEKTAVIRLLILFALRVVFYSGIPGENGIAPQKYYLGGKDVSVVLPVEEDRQTLINASIEVVNGQTVMKFTKLMKEVDHIEILHGENTFLWAHGSDSTLGYHQSRSQFVLTL